MIQDKEPSDLEEGDVFMQTIGFDGSTTYVVHKQDNIIGFSKFSWLADEIWTVQVEELEKDQNYLYLRSLSFFLGRLMILRGLVGRRYK